MKSIYSFIALLCAIVFPIVVKAQLNPPVGQYFFNPYQANPALGGMEAGLTLSGLVRKQFSTAPGAPLTQSLTADYQVGPKTGIGFNFYNERAGLLRQTQGMGTFAFHLPLNTAKDALSFGLGIGFMNERIEESDVVGAIDPSVGRLNERETFIDGSFGLAYTASALTIQGSIPHLKQVFTTETERNSIDRSLFFTAVSYKFRFGKEADSWFLEPKLCYRGIKGMDNIIDAGAQVGIIKDQIRFISIYHSSKSTSFGFGYHGISGLGIQAIYTAANNSTISALGNNFEINLKIRLF